MFTGIVEEVGRVMSLRRDGLSVAAKKVLVNTNIGDSIAVNGVCLTVVSLTDAGFTADVMPATLARTALGGLRPGDGVNLERALTLAGRLGGHIVTGHIDGVGRILRQETRENARILHVKAAPSILRLIVPQGSVAVDGVSLTVTCARDAEFSVSLIPHTRGATTLDEKKAGDPVHIENDIIGKYVERLLGAPREEKGQKSDMTLDFLREYGFCGE